MITKQIISDYRDLAVLLFQIIRNIKFFKPKHWRILAKGQFLENLIVFMTTHLELISNHPVYNHLAQIINCVSILISYGLYFDKDGLSKHQYLTFAIKVVPFNGEFSELRNYFYQVLNTSLTSSV